MTDNMDVYTLHALSSAGWLTLQSLPLLLTPSLVVTMLVTDPRQTTQLETYLCRTLGFTLLALAALELLLSGLLPIGTLGKGAAAEKESSDGNPSGGPMSSSDRGPYGQAAVNISVAYSGMTSFYLYAQLQKQGFQFAFTVGLLGNLLLFCVGIWVSLFAGQKGRTSKSTGADKRTGNFPFENKESAREKKKESKGLRKSILKRG